jgi:DNA-binding transcriptional LysR family regulator
MHGRDIDFNDVHVAFTFADGLPTEANVDARFFLSGSSLPVCSPALLANHGVSVGQSPDYRALGLLHDGDTTGWQRWFDHSGIAQSKALSGTTFEDFNLLRAAALSAQGVALCPIAMIQPDLQAGALVSLSDNPVHYGSDYFVMTAKGAPALVKDKIRVFADWVFSVR